MIGRILSLIFAAVMAVVLVTIFVINRHVVRLTLDPLSPSDPVFALDWPFYWFIFGFMLIGIILGGLATWFTQAKWRRMARQRTQEAMRWKSEAERLARERDANVIERKQLSLAE